MKVRLIKPFRDAEQLWIGLDAPGFRRKVFRFVSPQVGSEEFMAGITVFEPGESSSYHVHTDSEEINLVLGGSGTARFRGRGGSSSRPATRCGCPKASTTSIGTREPSRSGFSGCTRHRLSCRPPRPGGLSAAGTDARPAGAVT